MDSAVSSSNGKRKREDEDTKGDNTNKCVVKEGFSWWTGLMYDMPKSMTKPQPVDKNSKS